MGAPESTGAAGAPRPRAPTRKSFAVKVTICVWCERRSIHGIWDNLEIQIMPLTERHLIAPGICPDCSEDRAPNVSHPDEG